MRFRVENIQRVLRSIGLVSILAPLSLGFSGCGKQGFAVTASQQQEKAPGSAAIPPKVDILFVQDDMGSMIVPYSTIAQQFSGFLSTLQSNNWDWHFATAPLTSVQNITQAMASTYDGNWGSQWVAPYPGAQQNNADNLAASVFTLPQNFTWDVAPSNASDGFEPGFQDMYLNLTQSTQNTGFIRPDAMLVVILMGNGEDTSKVNLCYRSDATKVNGVWEGVVLPCDDPEIGMPTCTTPWPQSYNSTIVPPPYTGACGNSEASYQGYKAAFLGLKSTSITAPATNNGNFQFYADVSPSSGSCDGGYAFPGTRYDRLSTEISGTSFDVCTQQLSTVLGAVGSNLSTTMLNFVTGYLFISQAPNVSTIQITKYIGGDANNAVTIPQDPKNGWEYIGLQSNIDAIISPVPMDLSSGYTIQLNGTAQLVGNDTATVTYTPAGISASN